MARGFPRGGNTVVARGAVINDIQVIKLGTGKGRGVMAHRAILGSRNMRWDGHACRIGSIVAGRTVIHPAGMIEHRWYKGATGYVTDIAILGSVNMGGRRHADRIGTIVARHACYTRTHNVRAGMINESRGKTGRGAGEAMADPAIFGNGNMSNRHPYGPGRNIINTSIMA